MLIFYIHTSMPEAAEIASALEQYRNPLTAYLLGLKYGYQNPKTNGESYWNLISGVCPHKQAFFDGVAASKPLDQRCKLYVVENRRTALYTPPTNTTLTYFKAPLTLSLVCISAIAYMCH